MQISQIEKISKINKMPTMRCSRPLGLALLLIISTVQYSVSVVSFGQTDSFPNQVFYEDYKVDSLFLALLTNGDTSVDYNLVIKSNRSSVDVVLFGETIQDLTISDYNETEIKYESTPESNKIRLYPQSLHDIHVAYTTPDLVDKHNRNWTFSFSFPDKFLLKMPLQAHITHIEQPAFMTPSDDQNLWGFGPGNVQVSYVIGPVGTREEAQATIRSLEEGIKEARSNFNGIVLDNITALLEKVRSNFKQDKYLETVTHATNALTLLQNTSQSFIKAKDALSQAEGDIEKKRNNGFDTSHSEVTLSTARSLFQVGNYENAENASKQAVNQAEPNSDTISIANSYIAISILGVVVTIVAIGLVIFFVIRKRNNSVPNTKIGDSSPSEYDGYIESTKNDKEPTELDRSKTSTRKEPNLSAIRFNDSGSPHYGVGFKDYLENVVKEEGNKEENQENQYQVSPRALSPSGQPTINKKFLVEAVLRMKTQRPYLRNDDKELLDFLCEKEGSAFESEIRIKFVLPRTSLWRLIKRLEREELLEVRKIGGQNLIKLRFEDTPA